MDISARWRKHHTPTQTIQSSLGSTQIARIAVIERVKESTLGAVRGGIQSYETSSHFQTSFGKSTGIGGTNIMHRTATGRKPPTLHTQTISR